jgi:hypothetical protein
MGLKEMVGGCGGCAGHVTQNRDPLAGSHAQSDEFSGSLKYGVFVD